MVRSAQRNALPIATGTDAPSAGADTWHAVVGAPGFALGLRSDAHAIHMIAFLPPCPEQPPTNPLVAEAARQIRAYLADPGHVFSLPLRAAGTDFQRRVWAAIAAIPCGEVRTYGELAAELASTARAVGQACGDNPIPLIVPCHRVVARGSMGGFSHHAQGWLPEVKHWLLLHERPLPPLFAG